MKTRHISSDWLDERQRIFVQVYRPGWDWEELYTHMELVVPEIERQPGLINIISLHTTAYFAQNNLLMNLRRIFRGQPQNVQRILVVRKTSALMQSMTRLIDDVEFLDSAYMLVTSLATAFNVLQITRDDIHTSVLDDVDIDAPT